MKKLNKNEIVDLVAEKTHLSRVDAKASIDETFDIICEALLNGQSVNISGFCSLEPKMKAGRKGTHPVTHDLIDIAPKKTISITLSNDFKKKLNK